jgi:DTW domain-containing protein YfiP
MITPIESGGRRGRATCAACLRAACICRWIVPAASPVELLILQHPLEVRNAKNSARLLHLCLPGSRLVVGEAFAPDALHALLHERGRTPLLLYPSTPGAPDAALPDLSAPAALRLVVLDATWRKSRKMLHLNPVLHALPRLALRDTGPSGYRIRKAHAPDQLSTFEAAALALFQVEGGDDAYARHRLLLDAFDGFVSQQAAFDPARRQEGHDGQQGRP